MAKAYFIGLGGCGLQTVSELYKKLRADGFKPDEYLFTYIDTDEETRDLINEHELIIRPDDFKDLGATNPYITYREARDSKSPANKRLLEWAIEQDVPGHLVFPNTPLSDGAKAIRMIGRVGFYSNYDKIYTELSGKLGKFQDKETNDGKVVNPYVWVFASSNGGTGSSITLDVLYMINRIVNSDRNLGEPNVRLVLFMPKPFIDENKKNLSYSLNAYAYMWEMNAFHLSAINNEPDRFGQFAAYPPRINWNQDKFTPFQYIIPIDVESDQRNTINLKDLYPTAAEMVYYLLKGDFSHEMLSHLSNDIADINNITHLKERGHKDTDVLWTMPLVAYGYKAVRKANKELTFYLSIRAMCDILKYGLLGQEDIPVEQRDTLKKEFSKTYILSHLTDIAKLGVKASAADNLQKLVEQCYDDTPTPSAERLESNIVLNCLEQVEGVKESDRLTNVRKKVLTAIQEDVNTGICGIIREHGMKYAVGLLNLVDDYYLEADVKNELTRLLSQFQKESTDKRAECEQYLSQLKKKNRECLAAYNDYRAAELQLQTLTLALDIIDQLTRGRDGYLEELRKGANGKAGLNRLVQKTEHALARWMDSFDILAKSFIESRNNAFTTYLPDLGRIAQGVNQYWPAGTLFDNLYSQTVLDYDHELLEKKGIYKPSFRKETKTNFLLHYMQAIDTGNLLAELAMMDRNNLDSLRIFEERVLGQLQDAVKEVINSEGTPVADWLANSLEQVLYDDSEILGGVPLHKFVEGLSKDIHVLYPMRDSNVIHDCRYIYVGASENFAKETFGYEKSPGTQFIKDEKMKDCFLMIKMPYGLDFYSYAHFKNIERIYRQYYPDIMAQGQYAGCHLHKAFIKLNLDDAAREIVLSNSIHPIKLFTEALYFQEALRLLKTKDKDVFNEIIGTIDFSFGQVKQTDQPAADDGFDAMFSDGSASSDSGSNTFDPNDVICTDFDFFQMHVHKDSGPWQVDFNIKELSVDADGILMISPNPKLYVFDTKNLRSAADFADGLIQTGLLEELDKIVEVFHRLKKKPVISQAFFNVFALAKQAVLDMGTQDNPKFARFLKGWSGKPVNMDAIKAVSSTINNLNK